MTQFLRPDSNVTQTNFTGGFAEIDESSASDADFAYSANDSAATLEVGLSNPSGTPASGTTTVRYRYVKTQGGSPSSSGNNVSFQVHIYQGGTLIASDTGQTASLATWSARSFTPDMSSVTDWNDLRIRVSVTASGGGPSGRGVGISWAELEAPDAGTTYNETHGASVAAGEAIGSTGTYGVTHSASVAADAPSPGGLLYADAILESVQADFASPGGKGYYETLSASVGLSEASPATITEPNGWAKPGEPTGNWTQGASGSGSWTEINPTDVDWTQQ